MYNWWWWSFVSRFTMNLGKSGILFTSFCLLTIKYSSIIKIKQWNSRQAPKPNQTVLYISQHNNSFTQQCTAVSIIIVFQRQLLGFQSGTFPMVYECVSVSNKQIVLEIKYFSQRGRGQLLHGSEKCVSSVSVIIKQIVLEIKYLAQGSHH